MSGETCTGGTILAAGAVRGRLATSTHARPRGGGGAALRGARASRRPPGSAREEPARRARGFAERVRLSKHTGPRALAAGSAARGPRAGEAAPTTPRPRSPARSGRNGLPGWAGNPAETDAPGRGAAAPGARRAAWPPPAPGLSLPAAPRSSPPLPRGCRITAGSRGGSQLGPAGPCPGSLGTLPDASARPGWGDACPTASVPPEEAVRAP
ncbi:unnamed protein product [Nyctereutes procyonoides]|uniref:(raccoon dog) hypothetical protein n=1 Tax=Nyctereutes procyonoides TaxID=34880 RepID=A0A811YGX5_NYCPR|nr:unnamed protein product [Nyctereutes procyonoides]